MYNGHNGMINRLSRPLTFIPPAAGNTSPAHHRHILFVQFLQLSCGTLYEAQVFVQVPAFVSVPHMHSKDNIMQ